MKLLWPFLFRNGLRAASAHDIQIGTGREKRKESDLHKVHAIYFGTRLPKLYAFKIGMEGVHNIQKRILYQIDSLCHFLVPAAV